MHLRTKSCLLLVSVIAVYAIAEAVILDQVVMPGFVELEQQEARKDISRCVDAIQRETHHLKALCRDWSAWDDTYEFVLNKNKDYISGNLNDATLTANEFALVHYYDEQGSLIWGGEFDPETEKKVVIKEFSSETLETSHPLLSYPRRKALETSGKTGIVLTSVGPLIVASGPIITSTNGGPTRGTLVMARYLSGEVIETLKAQTRVNFKVWNLHGPDPLAPDAQTALSRLQGQSKSYLNESSDDQLSAYATLQDIHGKSALLLRADLPRRISAKGRAITDFALISTIIGSLLVLGVLIMSISSLVIRPVAVLTDHVKAISSSKDLSGRLDMQKNDELGELGRAFDTMAESLHEAKARLVEQSFHAGLAEMTENILHNVRNSTLPISGLVEASIETLTTLPTGRIDQAVSELNGDKIDKQRSRDLNTYLRRNGPRLTRAIRDTVEQLDQVLSSTDGLNRVLDSHNNLTRAKGIVETHQLAPIVDDAINLMDEQLHEQVSLEVKASISEQPAIMVERTTLSLVIAKVLDYVAKQIQGCGTPDRHVWIDSQLSTADDTQRIILSVTDHGLGLDAQEIRSLFEREQNTASSIGTELDLHWCANALTAMGGSIRAKSEGRDHGVTFQLAIPLTCKTPGSEATHPLA